MSTNKEKFAAAAASRGILHVRPEMELLLDILDGVDVTPVTNPVDKLGDGVKYQIKHSGGKKWDVVDAEGKVHADGNNLTKEAATALAAKLNAEG